MTVTGRAYVAYLIAPAQKNQGQLIFSHQPLTQQQQYIQRWIAERSAQCLEFFIESQHGQRNRHRWPVLQQAVDHCLAHGTYLLIGEINNLASNSEFCTQLLRLRQAQKEKKYAGDITCCDQLFIHLGNIEALIQHAKNQKKLHGELIKAGLRRSTAKSGNPNAQAVIAQINKPRIDHAIAFALMLQPIMMQYQARGYSQRKMVSSLNEEGFGAPEGGRWVLSQLQKVLSRIKLNDSALLLEKILVDYRARQYDNARIAELLNQRQIPAPQGHTCDASLVEKVLERVDQLHDIIEFNSFVMEIMPFLEKYHIDELTEELLAHDLREQGISLDKMR